MLLWGPGLEAELEFRRERIVRLSGRPAWADHVASAARGLVARRARARAERVHGDAAPVRAGEPGSFAVR
jgi:hypothetical protein